jgi:hypothetical protein
MLRYSFLPSDYHPMVLMLGETPGMRALGALLRNFGRAKQDVDLSMVDGFAASDTRISLTYVEDRQLGMYLVSRKDKALVWTLDQATAELFAETADELAARGLRSGSVRLTCGDYREIPVKVSRGEFTDDYLVFD